jgi:hypothetical protein
MKTVNKLKYRYDPAKERLAIMDGERNMGGFTGGYATRELMRLLDTDADIEFTTMKTEAERKHKIQRLRAIWISQGIDQHREVILESYGVQSTADLTHDQLDELIAQYSAANNRPVNDEVRRLRSTVLTLLTKYGVYTTNEDWARVNQFLMSPKIAGKLLYLMTEAELKTLIRKLHSMLAKREKQVDKEKREALLN